MNAYAVKTNVVRLEFAEDANLGTIHLAEAFALSATAPTLYLAEVIPVGVRVLDVVLDGPFRQALYSLSLWGMFYATGIEINETAQFQGLLATGPRLRTQDQRLRIDMDLFTRQGGDYALQTGDDYVREQIKRAIAWGDIVPVKALLRPSRLFRLRRRAETLVRSIPGVRAASVRLDDADGTDSLTIRVSARTDQSSLVLTLSPGGA